VKVLQLPSWLLFSQSHAFVPFELNRLHYDCGHTALERILMRERPYCFVDMV